MKRTYAILLILLLFTLNLFSQTSLDKGFNYLETGKYAQAEVFFKNYLKKDPSNKTAKLCYGRAIGLNGKTVEAVSLFTKLLEEYPKDYEIKLNYAESLLWNKNFDAAEGYYEKLVLEDSLSFSAQLGYANTLSNLKKYKKALLIIDKALDIQEGNPNALVSKKYIRLGYANTFTQAQEYEKALKLLYENLKDFKNDKETLLNIANIHLIVKNTEAAKLIYKKLSVNATDSIIGLNGIALAEHIAENDKEALKVARLAKKKVAVFGNGTLRNQTIERYIQSLIWNKKYSLAEKDIDSLIAIAPNENWVLSLHATLGLYRSDFKESVSDYNQILNNDIRSFDGNLGLANALRASDRNEEAYGAAFKTLSYYKNQEDASGFIQKLNTEYTPYVEEKISFTFDNGDNEAFSIKSNIEFPFSIKFKVLAEHQYRKTQNTVLNNEASSNNAFVGFVYRLFPKINLHSKIGINATSSFSNDFTNILAETSLKIKSFKLQDLEIGYKREIQNFNADLLDREILANNYFINYNISSNFNLGWFTQYFYTSQTDGNVRNLLFTSLYYNFLSKPVLKGGINYQFISFQDQVPTIYFSPERFNAVEVFIDFLKDENAALKKQWFYTISIAAGLQYIEDDSSQSTFRAQAKLGYKFSNRLLANFYGQYSNIASATSAGFAFTEIGFRFKWHFLEAPIFINKLKANASKNP